MFPHSSIIVKIEENAVKFKIAPRKHESILNMFFANNKNILENVNTEMMVRKKTHSGKTEMARRRKGPDTRVDGQIQTQIRRMKR